jgi:hypothetical protein
MQAAVARISAGINAKVSSSSGSVIIASAAAAADATSAAVRHPGSCVHLSSFILLSCCSCLFLTLLLPPFSMHH